MAHVYVRADGLASVLVSDNEYPQRVAHTLLSKVSNNLSISFLFYFIFCFICKIMDDFTNTYPPASWRNMNEQ